MMLSGFGEEPETEKIDEDELRNELDKKRAEKKKKFVLLSGLGDDEPQEDENLPEEKEDEPEKQPEKKKSTPRRLPSNMKSPNSAEESITVSRTPHRSSRPRLSVCACSKAYRCFCCSCRKFSSGRR